MAFSSSITGRRVFRSFDGAIFSDIIAIVAVNFTLFSIYVFSYTEIVESRIYFLSVISLFVVACYDAIWNQKFRISIPPAILLYAGWLGMAGITLLNRNDFQANLIFISTVKTLFVTEVVDDRDYALLRLGICLILVVIVFSLFAVMYDCKLSWPLLGALSGYAAGLKNGHRKDLNRKNLESRIERTGHVMH